MKPYYERDGITIYHGDCREIMPSLSPTCVITDPVWPDAHPDLEGSADPFGLWDSTLRLLPPSVERLIVWLGCASDPRFMRSIPTRLPFLRSQYLRRAVPSYKGRCLVSGDFVYAFGEWPASRPGARVIPGEAWDVTLIPSLRHDHPCARNQIHADWVVRWWGESTVLDPFAGVGSTLVSCVRYGIKAVGIEIEERYCEIAAKRLGRGVLFGVK